MLPAIIAKENSKEAGKGLQSICVAPLREYQFSHIMKPKERKKKFM